MTNTDHVIDLDAGRREAKGLPVMVKFDGYVYELPIELPASVLDPLFDGRLDELIELAGPILADGDDDLDVMSVLGQALRRNPLLPKTLLVAVRDVLAGLFAPDDWIRFQNSRPSLKDYLRLGKGLWAQYGLTLGEAWASRTSRGTDGATSNPTSPPPASTPGSSGWLVPTLS